MTIMLLALLATAGASVDESPAYREALVLYQELEFEQAVLRFEDALATPDLADADRARALLWIGVCRGQLGHHEATQRAFREALSLAPYTELPTLVPPSVAETFEAERRKAQHASTTEVEPAATAQSPKTREPAATAAPTTSTGFAEASTDNTDPWSSVLLGIGVGAGVTATAALAMSLVGAAVFAGSYLSIQDPALTQVEVSQRALLANFALATTGTGAIAAVALGAVSAVSTGAWVVLDE